MTANEINKLEQNPPKITTHRKNLKIINNKLMGQFGAEAFNISLRENQ